MIITTYSYYKNVYGGSLSEADFNKQYKKAGYKLDSLTFGRYRAADVSDASQQMVTDVNELVCNVVDKLADFDASSADAGEDVSLLKSIKVGSVSKTYATGSESGSSVEAVLYSTLRNLVQEYTGRYGWGCRWV